MKKLIWILAFILPLYSWSQSPFYTSSYYKEIYQANDSLVNTSFYPNFDAFNVFKNHTHDSSRFYYEFPIWFFNKNWLSVKEDGNSLQINPLINLSGGKELTSNSRTLLNNTRGIHAYGDFQNRVFYQFALCENQSRFMTYQDSFFLDRGEFYDNDSVFQKVNAVIPSGARTKPFKIDGFDYAFSYGTVAFKVNDKLILDGGNSQHFVGNGYRSLLLSDNSIYAPFVQLTYKINPKLTYRVLLRKQRNLFRKPHTKAVESQYEHKIFQANYLSYKVNQQIELSLFTGANALRADSITLHPVQWRSFAALPLVSSDLIFNNKLVNGISGLNIDFHLNNFNFYSQLVVDKYKSTYLTAFQAGVFIHHLSKLKKFTFRFETNYVPDYFYSHENLKLSYSHYNLPSAHTKGNNFLELFSQINFQHKRLYINTKIMYYFTKGNAFIKDEIRSNSIFSSDKSDLFDGNTSIFSVEMGYRINKKYNLVLFIHYQNRSSNFKQNYTNDFIQLGLRVDLFNQYLDF